jgi:hypothetical protein
MERSITNDLAFGANNELKVIDILKIHWKDDTITKTKNKYCKYDFESENCIWELKSRRNTKTQYPTTIIPEHKLIDIPKDYYFVFYFSNNICCYIKYDKELFETFKRKSVRCFRRGGNSNPIDHIEIPINLLVDI